MVQNASNAGASLTLGACFSPEPSAVDPLFSVDENCLPFTSQLNINFVSTFTGEVERRYMGSWKLFSKWLFFGIAPV